MCTEFKKVYDSVRSVVLLSVFAKLQKSQLGSLYITVCPSASKTLSPTGRMFTKFDMYYFSKICLENWSVIRKLTSKTGTLHGKLGNFMTIFRWIILRKRNSSKTFV